MGSLTVLLVFFRLQKRVKMQVEAEKMRVKLDILRRNHLVKQ